MTRESTSNFSMPREGSYSQPGPTQLLSDKQWVYVKRRYRMTDRELEIARYVCAGMNNEEIASRFKISPGTVKTHLRNIYRKTWVNTKIAMLLRFVNEANFLLPAEPH
jgi:DNA-binding CsgD family transcriptional regulator